MLAFKICLIMRILFCVQRLIEFEIFFGEYMHFEFVLHVNQIARLISEKLNKLFLARRNKLNNGP